MFDTQRAAEYFVVGWCKDWSMLDYLFTIFEAPIHKDDKTQRIGEMLSKAKENFPWLPANLALYVSGTRMRTFVGGSYPKLSGWLFQQESDVARLRCAAQIQRLKPPALKHALRKVADADRKEMRASSSAMRQAQSSYRLSRDAFKTHQRSAWNVCK